MDIQAATEAQKSSPKKILIFFYNPNSKASQRMENSTFGNAQLSNSINANYYPVMFDVTNGNNLTINERTFAPSQTGGLHQYAKFMNITSVPSIVFVDENSLPVTIVNGAVTAKELDPYIKLIAGQDYLKIDSQERWNAEQAKLKTKRKDLD